jgi:DNA invertase Pin-like site-specific DNA recombinase
MGKRRFSPKDQPQDQNQDYDLPLDRPAVVYYRQSTLGQVGNISTDIQRVDLVADMVRRGWQEDQVMLVDADAGVSGTLAIDERSGMRELFKNITTGQIGAVMTQEVDRLFRDVTQIQTNIFIDACYRNRVIVITPEMTYIFHHAMLGDFYKKAFRMKAEYAAEYLTFMKTRLGRARERLRSLGQWAGGRIALGYMVDVRQKVDGLPNPTYRKFVPYPAYAAVVVRLFELYVECGYSPYRTAEEAARRGLRFPDPKTTTPPEGYRFPMTKGGTKTGYLTPPAITKMVMNPIYIGHWLMNDRIVVWNNHEAIIPEDLFFRAFNSQSPFNLDGTPNQHYKPVRDYVRPSKDIQRDEPRPLLLGMLYVWLENKWRRVGSEWNDKRKYYSYHYLMWKLGEHRSWSRAAYLIDEAVVYHLWKRIKAAYIPSDYSDSLETKYQETDERRHMIEAQLASVIEQKTGIEQNLMAATLPPLIAKMEQRWIELDYEEARLRTILHEIASEQAETVNRWTPDVSYEKLFEGWDYNTREEKRALLRLFIDRVEIPTSNKHEANGVIRWVDNQETTFTVKNSRGAWSYAQVETLKEMLASGCTQEDLMEALGKSWAAIISYMDRAMPDVPTPRKRSVDKGWQKRYEAGDSQALDPPSETYPRQNFRTPLQRSSVKPFPASLMKKLTGR